MEASRIRFMADPAGKQDLGIQVASIPRHLKPAAIWVLAVPSHTFEVNSDDQLRFDGIPVE